MITRTLNPLHLEDLEPHRFEDLVRQLIYYFRTWEKIEATGRSGSDDGADIVAIEANMLTGALSADSDEDAVELGGDNHEPRLWIVQC